MNKERILKVADAIENHHFKTLGFNMESFIAEHSSDRSEHDCGTTACIAGWVHALQKGIKKTLMCKLADDIGEYAQKYLGLNDHQADRLFYEVNSNITDKEAVKVLRHLAETGVVDWQIVYDEREAA